MEFHKIPPLYVSSMLVAVVILVGLRIFYVLVQCIRLWRYSVDMNEKLSLLENEYFDTHGILKACRRSIYMRRTILAVDVLAMACLYMFIIVVAGISTTRFVYTVAFATMALATSITSQIVMWYYRSVGYRLTSGNLPQVREMKLIVGEIFEILVKADKIGYKKESLQKDELSEQLMLCSDKFIRIVKIDYVLYDLIDKCFGEVAKEATRNVISDAVSGLVRDYIDTNGESIRKFREELRRRMFTIRHIEWTVGINRSDFFADILAERHIDGNTPSAVSVQLAEAQCTDVDKLLPSRRSRVESNVRKSALSMFLSTIGFAPANANNIIDVANTTGGTDVFEKVTEATEVATKFADALHEDILTKSQNSTLKITNFVKSSGQEAATFYAFAILIVAIMFALHYYRRYGESNEMRIKSYTFVVSIYVLAMVAMVWTIVEQLSPTKKSSSVLLIIVISGYNMIFITCISYITCRQFRNIINRGRISNLERRLFAIDYTANIRKCMIRCAVVMAATLVTYSLSSRIRDDEQYTCLLWYIPIIAVEFIILLGCFTEPIIADL